MAKRSKLRPSDRVQRGAYTIHWNHPVPGTLTVQVRGRALQRLTPQARKCVEELLAERGQTMVGKSRGPYVWYTAGDEGQPVRKK